MPNKRLRIAFIRPLSQRHNKKPPAKKRFNVYARIEASSNLAVVAKRGLADRVNPLARKLQSWS